MRKRVVDSCSGTSQSPSLSFSDVSGTDRVVIPFMKKQFVELWDVLVLAVWTVLLLCIDVRFVWPCVVASACVCMRSRDLQAHECLAALYMLRHTCGAPRSPTAWLACPILALGVWARFDSYLKQPAMTRRLYTLLAVFLCLTLLHSTADLHWIAITRLLAYTLMTRYGVFNGMDTWDTIAQCAWILCSTPVCLLLLMPQANDAITSYPMGPSKRQSGYIWTAHGVAREEV